MTEYIYEDIWEEIKNKVSLVEEMEKHGLNLLYSANGRRVKVACPFHNERNPSLIININTDVQTYKCFGCGEKGSVIDYIMFAEYTSLKGALNYFKNNYALEYAKKDFSIEELMNKEKRKHFNIAKTSYMLKMSRMVRPFLKYSENYKHSLTLLKDSLILFDESVELGSVKYMERYIYQVNKIIQARKTLED